MTLLTTYNHGVAGHKADDSPRQPVETPDSLISIAYLKMVHVVSEGPIESFGTSNVYFNGTPLVGPTGDFNFQNVETDFRLGTPDQSFLIGFPGVENEVIDRIELRAESPIVRAVNGSDLTAIRIRLSTPQFLKNNTENGDIEGYNVTYAIDIREINAAFSTVIVSAFNGKTTSQYERGHRIDLPPGNQWEYRIRRLTPNAGLATIQDTMFQESYTQIIEAKLRYPNCALFACKIDAQSFAGVPEVAFFGRWRIIKVPANYNPETRQYATVGPGTTNGLWNGEFKLAWTNNPAWVYYDVLTNPLFGLGNRIKESDVDRYALYRIAQYCDVLVSDGRGGLEPRFTFNMQFQQGAAAFDVLRDLASVFRGIAYYMAGQMVAVADMPEEQGLIFTNSDVRNGEFEYSGTGLAARHTVALVSWSDNSNYGKQKVMPVNWDDGIARYGLNEISVTAIGCTSPGQAQRVGNHILASENLEDEMVTFSVGLSGMFATPGEVIQIADNARAGRNIGGRVASVAGRVITLDRTPDGMELGDILWLTMPDMDAQARTVTAINGKAVTVGVAYSDTPVEDATWATSSVRLGLMSARVVSVERREDAESGELYFEIGALKHVEAKFEFIDNGTRLDTPPIVGIPPSVQPPVPEVRLGSHAVLDQGIATSVLTIEWDKADKAVAYDVEWKRDDLPWSTRQRVGTMSFEVRNVYAGQYLARVHAVGAMGNVSVPTLSMLTQITGKTTPPPSLTSLVATSMPMGIQLQWGFPATGATDTERTEIWFNTGNNLEAAEKLGDFAYPQNKFSMQGLAAGVGFFFWGRLVDKSGNIGPYYPIDDGVYGESSSDSEEILSYIKGKIDETYFGPEFQEKIDELIPEMAGTTLGFAGDNTKFAGVWSQLYAQQEGDAFLAGRVDTVVSRFEETNAIVQTQIQTIASETSALATQVTTVQAQVDDTSAIVQQNSEAIVEVDGRLSATYSVRAQINADGKIYMAGMGLGVEQQPDGSYQTQILFQADRMALLSMANGQTYIPWAVENGQVFINQAFIKDGTITNAKIGNVIQSSALGAGGNPRWKLDKDGSMTLYGPNSGSGYLTINDSVIRVFDGAGTLRVRMGIW